MKRASLMIAALALLLGGVGQARADVTYNFTYSDSPYGNDVGHGTLVTTPASSYAGAMYATSGSLTMTSGLDAGTTFSLLTVVPGTSPAQPVGELPTLIPAFPSPFTVYADNLLYPNNDAGSNPNVGGLQPNTVSYLDADGLIFYSGSLLINLYGEGGPANYFLFDSTGGSSAYSGTFALTTAPEPSGITLLGLGIVCLVIGYAVRRRKLAIIAA